MALLSILFVTIYLSFGGVLPSFLLFFDLLDPDPDVDPDPKRRRFVLQMYVQYITKLSSGSIDGKRWPKDRLLRI
jgi:hypothetical protein